MHANEVKSNWRDVPKEDLLDKDKKAKERKREKSLPKTMDIN
jgi:hypothetical protein